MSRLIARILLSIFMLPLAAMMYLTFFIVAERSGWNPYSNLGYGSRQAFLFTISGTVTWVAIAVYWIAVWSGVVNWNSRRVIGTFAAIAVAALCGWFIYALLRESSTQVGAFVGSATAPMLWVVGTVFVWRETTAERAARLSNASEDALVCPICGYNLTGLSEPRCPECGSKFTLSELVAAQPKRQLAAMDHEVGG